MKDTFDLAALPGRADQDRLTSAKEMEGCTPETKSSAIHAIDLTLLHSFTTAASAPWDKLK
jgi:hypothetical protein